MRRSLMTAAVLGLVIGATARAGVIYDNGPPDLVNGYPSDHSAGIVGIELAANFVLRADSTLQDVHWWGLYSGNVLPSVDDFTIMVFADAGGKPADTPFYTDAVGDAVNRTDTGLVDTSGFIIYSYSADVTPLSLAAGTTYWLAIVNNTPDFDLDDWWWATSDDANGGDTQVRFLEGDQEWFRLVDPHGTELAFNLTGVSAVPEPSTLALAVIGGTALAGLVRRGRRV